MKTPVPPSSDSPPPVLQWTVHPMLDRWAQALVTVALVALVAWLVYDWMGQLVWAILAVVILLASLNRFFLPSNFEITDRGVVARYPFKTYRAPWTEVSDWVADRMVAVLFLSRRTPDDSTSHVEKGSPGRSRRILLLLGSQPDLVLDCLSRFAPRRAP